MANKLEDGDESQGVSLARPDACSYAQIISQHRRSLDVAHQALRDHSEKLLALAMRADSHHEQIAALSQDSRENHRLLVELKGKVNEVGHGQDLTRATVQATHELVVEHIKSALLDDEQKTTSGLKRYEAQTKRVVRVTALVAAVLIVLALLYDAFTGVPILPGLLSKFSGS